MTAVTLSKLHRSSVLQAMGMFPGDGCSSGGVTRDTTRMFDRVLVGWMAGIHRTAVQTIPPHTLERMVTSERSIRSRYLAPAQPAPRARRLTRAPDAGSVTSVQWRGLRRSITSDNEGSCDLNQPEGREGEPLNAAWPERTRLRP